MNTAEKLRLATQLEKLGVDVLEAGFPAASEGDLEAVSRIASKLERTEIAALARTAKDDIDRASPPWPGRPKMISTGPGRQSAMLPNQESIPLSPPPTSIWNTS
jgi:hypothetical protein